MSGSRVARFVLIAVLAVSLGGEGETPRVPLDPRGKIHIPIGIPNSLDTLKTFVEAEGNFSPGFGSYGIYFWLFEHNHNAGRWRPGRFGMYGSRPRSLGRDTGKLIAPTMDGVQCDHGLGGTGYLIPWAWWRTRDFAVRTEVCEVSRASPDGQVFVVGARACVTNLSDEERKVSLYVALRPLGPAGWAVRNLSVSDDGGALLVNGHAAIVANEKPSRAGVIGSDNVSEFALAGKIPSDRSASSETGDCSGALRFDVALQPGESRTFGFVCPVLPGRRAVGHKWDGKSTWAQLDEAVPNPAEGGVLQPDPGLEYYRGIRADTLFEEANAYWEGFVGRATIKVPDPGWGKCFAAIVGHVAMCMNEGAPDVAVVNYNVFNRDGVYTANILQKSGHFDLASEAIDYFLSHPFSGRVYPEADNPGQVLWVIGEQWLFARDERWLKRAYPSVKKLVEMIEYYRTTAEPHWVSSTSLDFGNDLPANKRQELKPGSCDGYHPEYTEAFDIAGLRKACVLAEALGCDSDAAQWRRLADLLFDEYDEKFGSRLAREYGSYSVIWPCRLYPLSAGKAHERFKKVGWGPPGDWRYFPLANAHQGLLAGSRLAGYVTLQAHLYHEQMRGWYAFDEGGKSGPGGWRHVRTTWNPDVAMPHGWAIAEVWLLMRDSLLFEDEDRLVLFSGIPPDWFSDRTGMEIKGLPTHFGSCSLSYAADGSGATLILSGSAAPPGGFLLRLPPSLEAKLTADGKPVPRRDNGEFFLPPDAKEARIEFVGGK